MKTFLLLSLPLFFAGCISPHTSPEPKYYQLRKSEISERTEKDFSIPFLVIGPVDLNPYLDHPRFALRIGQHEIQYQEYQRWAEPLELNISSVLAANLRQYFQTTVISPIAPKLLLGKEQGRVMILINRMDVDSEGNAELEVQWAMLNRDGKENSIIHESLYKSIAQDTGMLARVEALNDCITAFSLDLAKGIENEL